MDLDKIAVRPWGIPNELDGTKHNEKMHASVTTQLVLPYAMNFITCVGIKTRGKCQNITVEVEKSR